MLGKVEHQRTSFLWEFEETGMESEGQEKCWNIFLLGFWFLCQKIASRWRGAEALTVAVLFVLACLPIPLPGLESISQSKSFTSFFSTNLLSYSSSSCKGWGRSPWNWPFCCFINQAIVGSWTWMLVAVPSLSEVLGLLPPGGLVCVTRLWAGIHLGRNLSKPFWPCVCYLLPGCLGLWAVGLGFNYILLHLCWKSGLWFPWEGSVGELENTGDAVSGAASTVALEAGRTESTRLLDSDRLFWDKLFSVSGI